MTDKAIAFLGGHDAPSIEQSAAVSPRDTHPPLKRNERTLYVTETWAYNERKFFAEETRPSGVTEPLEATIIPTEITKKAKRSPVTLKRDEQAIAWLYSPNVPPVKRNKPTVSGGERPSSINQDEVAVSPKTTNITMEVAEEAQDKRVTSKRDEKAIAWLCSHDTPPIKRKEPIASLEARLSSVMNDEPTVSLRDDQFSVVIEPPTKTDEAQKIKCSPVMPYRDQKATAWLSGYDVPTAKRKEPSVSPNISNKTSQTGKPASIHTVKKSSEISEDCKLPLNRSASNHEPDTIEVPLQLTADSLQKVRTSEDFPLIKRKKSHSTWDISTDPTPPDIRHEIGPENHMMRIDGMISRRPYDLVEEDVVLNSETFRNAFIENWISNVRVQVSVDMTNAASFLNRDIDTFTGAYLPPQDHPTCNWDQEAYFRSTPLEREHSEKWTSNFLIARETSIREMRERRKSAKQHAQDRYTPSPDIEYEIAETPDQVLPEVTAEYILRPAIWNDLQGIAKIYNDEVDSGLRAWDTEHVKISDFNHIGAHCSQNQLPFIVAVDRRENLNGDGGYLPSPATARGNTQETVLGFGYLQLLDGGIGVGKHVGRLSAKLTVYVDRQHRKKHIGSAIVDRILLHMSRGHPGNSIKHKWESVKTHPYNDLEMNRRERLAVNRIIVEGLFRGKRDPDWSWFDKMMKGFQFDVVGHVEGAYSTRRGMQSEILDKFIWLHDAQVPEPDGSGRGAGERMVME